MSRKLDVSRLSANDLAKVINADHAAEMAKLNYIKGEIKKMSPAAAKAFATAIGKVASDGGCGSFGCC